MHMTVDSVLNGEHLPYRLDNFEIYLDGGKQSRVVELDTTVGYVVRYMEHGGNLVTSGDEVLTETIYGNVEIILK